MACLDFRILQEESNTEDNWANTWHWFFRVWSVREGESNFGKMLFFISLANIDTCVVSMLFDKLVWKLYQEY